MEKIVSKINVNSPEFKNNHTTYSNLVQENKKLLQQLQAGGSERAVEKHKSRGKLLVRQRIDLLIDSDTPFLELSPMAALRMYNDSFPAAGIVTGIGIVHGMEVMIIANDATVKGGTYVKETIKKHLRAQEIAMENQLPCVYLVDSGGVFLPEQANVFPDRDHFGRFFYNQAKLSAHKIPQISVVMGSCTAGGAYIPAMSDETIIVRNQGTIFIGGPPLVKTATGEEVSAEELGGAEVHTSISGVADHLAENDKHAMQICRNIFETIKPDNKQNLKRITPQPPAYSIDELYGIAPIDLKKQIDVKEIIARLVDGSFFHEFKANYAPTLIAGFAHIMGYPVGIIANNGVLFSETSLKGAHFVELCAARNTPIVFLQNITGFIVGKQYEHKGIARDGAKFVHAVANVAVPKFTIIWGGSFGAGNYAMAGRAFNPRLLFMWPAAKISVMGGEQAAGVLTSIKEQQLKTKGKAIDKEELTKIHNEILRKYETEGAATYSTARLWDDGIIDPADTRKILGLSIAMSLNRKFEDTKFGVFRM